MERRVYDQVEEVTEVGGSSSRGREVVPPERHQRPATGSDDDLMLPKHARVATQLVVSHARFDRIAKLMDEESGAVAWQKVFDLRLQRQRADGNGPYRMLKPRGLEAPSHAHAATNGA